MASALGSNEPTSGDYADIVANARRLRLFASLVAGVGWIAVLSAVLFFIGILLANEMPERLVSLAEMIGSAVSAVMFMAVAALLRFLAGVGLAVRDMAAK